MTPSTWNVSCSCLKWLEPKPIVLLPNQTANVSFQLDTRGMQGVVHKELMFDVDDDVGLHVIPVECEVVQPSNQPQVIRLGELSQGQPREVKVEVGPGPTGAEVRVRSVASTDPSLVFVSATPAKFSSGRGMLVTLILTPTPLSPEVVKVTLELDKPAPVTQVVSVEYVKTAQ